MSENKLTPREREYLDCEVPMVPKDAAAKRLTVGILTSLAQSVVTPGAGKADQKLFRTIREIRYTKYKKAVLRKLDGTPEKNDEKILKKLNKKEFVLGSDSFDPDEYTRQIYEEYMKSHNNGE